MLLLVLETIHWFLLLLEGCILTYIVLLGIPFGKSVKNFLEGFLEPILSSVRFLLKHSIFRTTTYDMSPLVILVLISYLQFVFQAYNWSTL